MVDDRGYGIMTVAPGNRLTQVGDTRYEYDGYGNRILEVTGEEEQHYEWDTEHRLTGYRCRVRGQETVHYRYQYDALGRRILKEDILTRTARCSCSAGGKRTPACTIRPAPPPACRLSCATSGAASSGQPCCAATVRCIIHPHH